MNVILLFSVMHFFSLFLVRRNEVGGTAPTVPTVTTALNLSRTVFIERKVARQLHILQMFQG